MWEKQTNKHNCKGSILSLQMETGGESARGQIPAHNNKQTNTLLQKYFFPITITQAFPPFSGYLAGILLFHLIGAYVVILV